MVKTEAADGNGLHPKHWKDFAGAAAPPLDFVFTLCIRLQVSRYPTGRADLSPPIGVILIPNTSTNHNMPSWGTSWRVLVMIGSMLNRVMSSMASVLGISYSNS
jgi:hypothetical protein